MSKSVMLLTAFFSLTALAGPSSAPAQLRPAVKSSPQMICVCNAGGCHCILVEITESGGEVY
jgi:hypothetical protein